MLEKTVKIALKKRLKALGAYQHWPVQTGYGNVCLDCHACINGQYIAIETKRPGKKMTALQEITAEQIRAAGGLVFTIDSVEQASEFFSDRIASDGTTARTL